MMKVIGLILVLALSLILSVGVLGALAETTDRGNYTTPIPPLTDWLNTNPDFHHNHGYIDNDSYQDRYSEYEPLRKNPLGLGLDLVVWEFDGLPKNCGVDAIEIQNKWDMANREYSGYAVVKANPFRVIKGWFGIK
jgi:hypothetical protein